MTALASRVSDARADRPSSPLRPGDDPGGPPARLPRPENYARSLFHVGNGVVSLLVVELAPAWMLPLASTFLAAAVLMETGRKWSPAVNRALMRLFAKVAHPHEHVRVNSASWYTLALFVLALTRTPYLCAVGVIVLGVADPAAGFVGRRWGRHRFANGRSLEGTLAFVAAGTAAAAAVLWGFHPSFRYALGLGAAFGAALVAGLVELGSDHVDDNLSIPLAAAAGAYVVVALVPI